MNARTLQALNALSEEEAFAQFMKCCGAHRWAIAMTGRRPFRDADHLFRAAEQVFDQLEREDWMEAFDAHPKIGDLESLRRKFADTADMTEGEQAGVVGAPEEVLRALAVGNEEYQRRFGHIFITAAAGKSAEQMLGELQDRSKAEPEAEIKMAAGEQRKITRRRLETLELP